MSLQAVAPRHNFASKQKCERFLHEKIRFANLAHFIYGILLQSQDYAIRTGAARFLVERHGKPFLANHVAG